MANRNIGRLLATCTSETVSGSGSRLVMSQPEATLYIQPPTFDTTVAPQMTAKILWRNGAHTGAEGRDPPGDAWLIPYFSSSGRRPRLRRLDDPLELETGGIDHCEQAGSPAQEHD